MACNSWASDAGCVQVDGCPDYCSGLTNTTLHSSAGCAGQVVLTHGLALYGDGAGGKWFWDGDQDKANADLGTIIDPSVAFTLTAQGTGTGTGCWVRDYSDTVNIRWFNAKGDGSTDDTAAINSAITASATRGYSVYAPIGHYIVAGTINLLHKMKFYGEYAGHGEDRGAVFERPESTASVEPIISLVYAGSSPMLELSDFTLVGDTTVEHGGIYIESVGLHNPEFRNIHIEYVQGVPIEIFQKSDIARCEFAKFERVIVGMDWGTYGSRLGADSKPDNTTCNGIYLNNTGYPDATFDQIVIDHCTMLAGGTGSAIIKANVIGDLITLRNSSFNGGVYLLYGYQREAVVTGCYIENTSIAFYLTNNPSSSTRGVKVFHIDGCLFASVPKILYLNDTASDLGYATKGVIENFYVYTNYSGDMVNGASIIDLMGFKTSVEIGYYASNMSGDAGGTSTDLRAVNTGMASYASKIKNVKGFLSHLTHTKKDEFNEIRYSPPDKSFLGDYRLYVNSDASNDYGLVMERTLSNDATYAPYQFGSAGGFQLKTSNSDGSTIVTAVSAASNGATTIPLLNVGASYYRTGAGTPETVVSAPPGSMYTDTNGGAGSTLYVKESGTGTTGWVAK